MLKRKKITACDESEVLIRSRRRCALCFGLENDTREKNGQIAHIDKNRSNSEITNLVFLCFDHHDRYDSTTSQSKGIKKKELIKYRNDLYKYIGAWGRGEDSINSSLDSIDDLFDKFYLYISPRENSTLGHPFIARNTVEKHVVFITENRFSIDHCNPAVSEDINKNYRNTGISFYIPMRAISTLLSKQLKEDQFYITYELSGEDVFEIEFGLSHEDARNSRVYFFDKSLNLKNEWMYRMDKHHEDIEIMKKVVEVVGQVPLKFIKKIYI